MHTQSQPIALVSKCACPAAFQNEAGHPHTAIKDRQLDAACNADLPNMHAYDCCKHVQVQYSDGTAKSAAMAKDELTCAAYWDLLGFENPVPDDRQREFKLCGAYCGSELHDEDDGMAA